MRKSEELGREQFLGRSMTLCLAKEDVPKVNKIMANFRYKIRGLLNTGGPKDDVYKFEFHFFPLTNQEVE